MWVRTVLQKERRKTYCYDDLPVPTLHLSSNHSAYFRIKRSFAKIDHLSPAFAKKLSGTYKGEIQPDVTT